MNDEFLNYVISFEYFIDSFFYEVVFISFFFLFISYFSGFLEKKSAKKRISYIKSIRELETMGWREFEEILADYYTLRGYRVSLAGGSGGGGDGGIDLILKKRRSKNNCSS